jgi:hypothetical protein
MASTSGSLAWNVSGGANPISAPLAQIQTYHENADSLHGKRPDLARGTPFDWHRLSPR